MEPITPATLTELLVPRDVPCVSLFMPVESGNFNARRNARRLKGMLADTEQRLSTLGLSPKGRTQFLAAARAFAEDGVPAPKGARTLSMFLCPGTSHAYFLPQASAEFMVTGAHFHITPLLPEACSAADDVHAEAIEQFTKAKTEGRALTDPVEIARAARDMRVSLLLAVTDTTVWGLIDPVTHDISRHERQWEKSEDLVGFAAGQTLIHGGNVLVLPRETMPDGAGMVAVIR